MDFPQARQRFYEEINLPDEEIDLSKAALYLTQEEYPDLEPQKYLDALESMAAAVAKRLPSERYPLRMIQILNQYLYEELGFIGNTANYYDPRNSYLNDVIDRRLGIPITLSLVYLEVARRINFPMVGVGMPGHFLVRPAVEEMLVFVDPFHGGETMFPEDCQERLSEIYGRPVDLQPEYLEPVGSRYFLARMLTNLKGIYIDQKDDLRTLAMIDRILLLFPNALTEQRDRGFIYFKLERWSEARQDFTDYLEQVPAAPDRRVILELLDQILDQIQDEPDLTD
jgi:regulator of sirC expression with transglutaminase-like and TPR domain